jgi:hypothetical protein
MEALIAWWGTWGQIVLIGLGVLAGLATWIARGEGRQLAALVVDLILRLGATGWDAVTETQVREIAGLVYDGAYNWAGPPWLRVIPWRLWVTRVMVQNWAWQAFCRAHAWFDSALAAKALEAAQADRVVPAYLKL